MHTAIHRRNFLTRSIGLAGASAAFSSLTLETARAQGKVTRTAGSRFKLGLNAYSFDKALLDGSTTLEDVVHFCAAQGLDCLDATGYYFPGYPKVPSDESIHRLKRTAFVNGVSI